MKRRQRNETQEKTVMHSTITHQPLPTAQPITHSNHQLLGRSPSLYLGSDVLWCGKSLWPVQGTCPSSALSHFLEHLLAGRAWETEKTLTSGKHCSGTAKTSMCNQHYSESKSQTQH